MSIEQLQENLQGYRTELSEKETELVAVEARLEIANDELQTSGARYSENFFALVRANTELGEAQAKQNVAQARKDESQIDVQEDQERVNILTNEKATLEGRITHLRDIAIPHVERSIENLGG